MKNRNPKHNLQWKEAKRIVDSTGSYLVIIDTLPTVPYPRYSFRVGGFRPDETGSPNIRVRVEGNFKFTINNPPSKVIGELLQKAEEWVLTEVALKFDDNITSKIEKEKKQIDFGKTEVRKTGKTARKKVKLPIFLLNELKNSV